MALDGSAIAHTLEEECQSIGCRCTEVRRLQMINGEMPFDCFYFLWGGRNKVNILE